MPSFGSPKPTRAARGRPGRSATPARRRRRRTKNCWMPGGTHRRRAARRRRVAPRPVRGCRRRRRRMPRSRRRPARRLRRSAFGSDRATAGRADTTASSASGTPPAPASCTLCSRNTRLSSADSSRSAVGRDRASPPAAPSRPSSTRALSRSVCSRPRNQVPVFAEALVVEIDRVLRRQHHADAERARLLEQRQQRRLRRRVRDRRKVAEDLVHVEDRAQARRAGLPAHPGHDLVEQQRHEEHALGVAEVRDREDRDARLPFRRVEQRSPDRAARPPSIARSRRREQPVQLHRELEALLRRKERLEVERRRPSGTAASGPAG